MAKEAKQPRGCSIQEEIYENFENVPRCFCSDGCTLSRDCTRHRSSCAGKLNARSEERGSRPWSVGRWLELGQGDSSARSQRTARDSGTAFIDFFAQRCCYRQTGSGAAGWSSCIGRTLLCRCSDLDCWQRRQSCRTGLCSCLCS